MQDSAKRATPYEWRRITILFSLALCALILTAYTLQPAWIINDEDNTYKYYQSNIFGSKILCCLGPDGISIVKVWENTEYLGIMNNQENQYLLIQKGNLLQAYPPGVLRAEQGALILGIEKQLDSYCIRDIDLDGTDEILILSGYRFIIMSFQGKAVQLYDKTYPNLKPWKVQCSDVDGDGRVEIALGVFKESEFHPIAAKRPYIYDWDCETLIPKWRGSRLAHPFEDFIFQDVDGNGTDEIVAIEYLEDGRQAVHAYYWKGFGFESLLLSQPFEIIEDIWRGTDKEIGVRYKTSDGLVEIDMVYHEGEWEYEEKNEKQ
jgi:hypothetical protein